MRARSWRTPLLGLTVLMLVLAAGARSTAAGAAEWHLEQKIVLPPAPPGVPPGSGAPIGLGRVGDLEFWAPNRGLLITDGNGSTIEPGVWSYNGEKWQELANVCGATDGRIAWAAENEFWTVSDGRPGQAANPNGVLPPLEDNTLCRFAVVAKSEGGSSAEHLEVLTSYASPAFEGNSYQPMDAAACIDSSDCWFAGAPLPAPQTGAFHLHWNGSSLQSEANLRAKDVQSLSVFQGGLFEGIGLLEEIAGERPEEILHPSILQEILPEGSVRVFEPLHPARLTGSGEAAVPEYAVGSRPQALAPLRLSSAEDELWAAAGPVEVPPKGSNLGALTVLRDADGDWSQVLGPEETGPENNPRKSGSITVDPPALEDDVVSSIAAEPGGASAWLALDTQLDSDSEHPSPTALATVAHVQANGQLTVQQLPSEAERAEDVSPKGAAYRIACPAQNDCWLITTQGWLFHLSEGGASVPLDEDPAFFSALVTHRPEDQGVPQQPDDAPPVDDSGLEEFQPESASKEAALTKLTTPDTFATVSVPLLSDMHTRVLHRTTLELSFHLAVKARVRLIAKRSSKVVASTSMRTLNAGKRSLQLHLNVNHWPTKLDLQTHALAPLPTTSTRSAGVESVSTSLAFPNALGIAGWGPSF
jgi:hypothetical protein